MSIGPLPPSDWMVLRLIIGLSVLRGVRRWFNQLLVTNRTREEMLADRRANATGSRPPTPRKKLKTGLVLAFFVLLSLWQTVLLESLFLGSLSLERSLQPSTLEQLSALQKQSEQKRSDARETADAMIANDPLIVSLPAEQQTPTTNAISHHWVERGNQAFTPSESLMDALPDAKAVYPVQYERLVTFTSIALFLMLMAIVTGALGQPTQEIGRLDAGTLWLISLPIPARLLFLATIIEYTLKPVFWVCILPFMVLCALAGDHGWAAPFIAFAVCLPLAVALASLRLGMETAIRLHLRRTWRKDVQITCRLISTLLMFYLVYLVITYHGASLWGRDLLPWAHLPIAWPLRAVLTPGAGIVPWLIFNALFSVAVILLGILYSVRAVRGGFVSDPGTLQGTRPTHLSWARKRSTLWTPLSLISKDLRMLYRDRAFLFNTLMLPVIMIGVQFFFLPELVAAVRGSFRHACTLVYVLAAYLLMPSATTVLSAEGTALWLMTAAPQPLLRLLQQKLVLWTGLALIYTIAAFAAVLTLTPWPGSSGFADAIMVLLGIPIFAVIAAGLGAAGSDPNDANPHLRNDAGIQMALMMIMTMHAQAIYTATVHGRLAWIMLCAVFAYALWQRLEERLPWLLDPIDNPPPRIDLTHGALAAMAFMFLQSLIGLFLLWIDTPRSLMVLISFAGAGVITVLSTLWLFWRNQFRDILHSTGLVPREGVRRTLLRNLILGWAGGLLAALIGELYTYFLSYFPLLTQDASHALMQLPWGVLFVLAVFAAPLAEEFLFRGLLFQGLKATIPLRWAVPASAAVFALIHPTLSVLPVFAVGCITAVVYHKSRWLLAPVLVHGLYNGAMVMG